MAAAVRIKRIYEPASSADGARLLVDRVWPRGITKEAAALTMWIKEVAPSTALRKWFGHDPARWPEFHRRYLDELAANTPAVDRIRTTSKPVARPCSTLHMIPRTTTPSRSRIICASSPGPVMSCEPHPRARLRARRQRRATHPAARVCRCA
jgi:uncharacterized protein YeaO (DUF488 family)